jgi:hypothetical protein
LTSFAQGEKMTNPHFNLVDSILVVKASGGLDVDRDLALPEGKSIAQLIYDQEKKATKISQDPKE